MQFDKETQQRILRVAGQRIEGQDVDEIDERIAHVMDLHPEYEEIWKMGEMAVYPQEIDGKVVNPFVHTVLHVTVDKQIMDETPDFVVETFHRLKNDGGEEHEVLHAIIGVYADMYFKNFRRGDTFSNLDYKAELDQLYLNKEKQEG